MSQAVTTATLKAFLAAFNAHDPDAIMEFFADDCEPCKDSCWKIVEH